MVCPRPWPLPFEVTTMILEDVHRIDLVALSLVCKAVQIVAQPRLYTDITLTRKPSIGRHPFSLYQLLNTMIERVDLASRVQSLNLCRSPLNAFENERSNLPESRLNATGHPKPSLEGPIVNAWDLDPTLVHLISSLPRLQYLELNLRYEFDSIAFGEMVRHATLNGNHPKSLLPAASSTMSLNSIRCVSHHTIVNLFPFSLPYQHQRQAGFGDFLWLFYFPSIEIIRATIVEGSYSLKWPGNPPMASSLTTLLLPKSYVNEASLESIFKASPNLEVFEYHFACDDETYWLRENGVLHCDRLGHAMRLLKNSLKTLVITLTFIPQSEWDFGWDYPFGISGKLGRLNDFLKLTKLQAPFAVLFGLKPTGLRIVDALPEGLREICCTNDMSSWDCFSWTRSSVLQQFHGYLCSENCLELDELELKATTRFDSLWYPIRHELELFCQSAGVRLKTDGIESFSD